MGTNKLIDKLEKYINLSEKKRHKKHDKLQKIIHELEEKKSRLEQKALDERKIDASSSRYRNLNRKILVISNLISKANRKDLAD